MHDDVGVAPDGGGEVCVDWRSEAVVQKLRPFGEAGAEVLGARHAPGRHDSEERVEVGPAFELRGIKRV
eukprot:SAG11_NODE_3702_length_2269_cov_8.750000_2_plen_69_part_00